MIHIEIPGRKALHLKHLVVDYNGTLAIEGKLIPSAKEKLQSLSEKINIHIVTADTFGAAARELEGIPCELKILSKTNQQQQKEEYILSLNPDVVVAIGNGKNDALMLQRAILGIAIIQEEGASVAAIRSADVACINIIDVFDSLLNPQRLTATLRF